MNPKRILSAVIYCVIVLYAVFQLDNKAIFIAIFGTLIPVLMIWFPEEINDYTLGLTGEGSTIDKPTPAIFISGFGWLILLGIPLFILFV